MRTWNQLDPAKNLIVWLIFSGIFYWYAWINSQFFADVRSPEAPVEIPPLDTLESKKDFIKEVFLVDMPDDFYDLWSVAKSLNSEHPSGKAIIFMVFISIYGILVVSAAFECAGFTLIGPYDILASKIEQTKKLTKSDFLTHCRYFYDPPEFQTVLKGDDDEQLHIGYYR